MVHFWLKLFLLSTASLPQCDAHPVSKLEDAYAQMIGYAPERTKFSRQFVGPIATVAGEPVYPRSYSRGGPVFLDENGASYPLSYSYVDGVTHARVQSNLDGRLG